MADPNNDYTYDALYRLIKCEGREHAGSNAAVSYKDSTRIGKNPLPTDASAMRRYAQYYKYDGVGNMLQIKHTTTGGTGNWTRNFVISGTTNRLTESSIGSNGTGTESYDYDNRGNMVDGMNHLLSMTYNEENRLEQVEINSSQTACYQYDHDGQRVRKVITNTSAAIWQVRKYVGNWEVYQKIDTGTNTVVLERETLHVEDDQKRIALIDTPTVDTLSTGEAQLLRYQYSNNINTASLELDENAAVITYEEYYPYGNTSYQGGRSVAECSLKRYRYTGKERDEETGLNYHGARYYAPWLARWTACEPLSSTYYVCCKGKEKKAKEAGIGLLLLSSYIYVTNNPIKLLDGDGEVAVIDDILGALVIGFAVGFVSSIVKSVVQDGFGALGNWRTYAKGLVNGVGGALVVGSTLVGFSPIAAGAIVGVWTSISEDVIDKKPPDLTKALVSGALGAGSQWLTGALKADSYLIGALGNGNKEAAGVVIERIGVLFDFGLGLINDDQAAKGYSKEDKDDNVVYRDLDVIMVSAKRLTPSLISELARKIMRGAFKKHADLY